MAENSGIQSIGCDLDETQKKLEEMLLLEEETNRSPTCYSEIISLQQKKIDSLVAENLLHRSELQKKNKAQEEIMNQLQKQQQNYEAVLRHMQFNPLQNQQVLTDPSTVFGKNNGRQNINPCSKSPLIQDNSRPWSTPPDYQVSFNGSQQMQTGLSVLPNVQDELLVRSTPSIPTVEQQQQPHIFATSQVSAGNAYVPIIQQPSSSKIGSQQMFGNFLSPQTNPFLSSSFCDSPMILGTEESLNTTSKNKENGAEILPYKAWLKKHNLKQNQTFRGKRGGNVKKRKFFANKFSKQTLSTNTTLTNVASFHIALANEAANSTKKPKKVMF